MTFRSINTVKTCEILKGHSKDDGNSATVGRATVQKGEGPQKGHSAVKY